MNDDPQHPATDSPALIRFSTQDVAEADRYDAFALRINTMFDIVPGPSPREGDFFGRIFSAHTGQMVVSAMETETFRFQRTRQRIIMDHLDHIMLRVDLDGPWDNGGKAAALTVIDLAAEMPPAIVPNHNISLVIGRRALGDDVGYVESLHGHSLDAAETLILGDHIISLMRHADRLGLEAAHALCEVTPALILACLRPSARANAAARRELSLLMLERGRNCIRANLYNENLTPAFMADQLGMSRASLYRLFEPVGGVAAAIRVARLRRALRDMGASDDRKLSDIAHALGFSSNAHFSRAFRQHYGCSPSDAKALLRQGVPVPATGPMRQVEVRFPEWLQSL